MTSILEGVPGSVQQRTLETLCVDLLREFGHLVGIPNSFKVLSPAEQQAWIAEAFDKWFPTVTDSPPPGIRRLLLSKITRFRAPTGFQQLQQIARDLIASQGESLRLQSIATATDWHAETLSVLQDMDKLARIGGQLKGDMDDFLAINLCDIARCHQRILRRQELGTSDDDVIGAEIEALMAKPSWRWRGRASTIGGVNRATLLEQRDALKARIDDYVAQAKHRTAALLARELAPVIGLYEEIKNRRGALDARDVIRTVENLLHAHPEVQQKLRIRRSRINPLPRDERRTPEPNFLNLQIPSLPSRYGRVMPFQIEQALPESVSAFVASMLHRSDANSSRVLAEGVLPSPEPKRVGLLFPSIFNADGEDVRAPYMRALEARGIAYTATETRQSFFAREEVNAICQLLNAIEWLSDELQVYAVLRGPLFGFSDESLFLFRHRYGSLKKQALQVSLDLTGEDADLAELVDINDVLNVLESLHAKRNQRSIGETLEAALEAAHVRTNVAFWRCGTQALQSIDIISDLASSFVHRNGQSFRAFATFLRQDVPNTLIQLGECTRTTDAVKLLTLEEARGHDFSVTILCAPTAAIDKDDVCDAVIASTHDLLVIPTLGGAPIEGWTGPFQPLLQSDRRVLRWNATAQPDAAAPINGLRHQHTLEPGDDDGRASFDAWLSEQQAILDAAVRPLHTIIDAKSAPAPVLPEEVQLRIERYTGDAHPAAKLAWILNHPFFTQAAASRMETLCFQQSDIFYKDADGQLYECPADFVFQHKPDKIWTVLNIRLAENVSTISLYENELAHCVFGVHMVTRQPVSGRLLLV